jgi:TPR repeat protein
VAVALPAPSPTRRLASALAACAAASLVACAHEYHPEYHPETRTAYVQNVTYAQNAWVLPQPANIAPSTEGTYALSGGGGGGDAACAPGRPADCWRDCFKRASGDACLELASMYEAGYGVVPSHETAQRLKTRACELGACGPLRTAWRGDVTSPGAIVVYGDFKGNVLIGR